jgi:hypothetical protein
MPSGEIILAVHPGVMGRRKLRGKIGSQGCGIAVAQCGADNLFYLAVMQVNTRTEAHFFIFLYENTQGVTLSWLNTAPLGLLFTPE